MVLTIVGNLIDNAIDAAAAGPGAGDGDRAPGDLRGKVTIEVSDSGPGVPEELTAQIFTDGFTTKSGRRAPPPRNRACARAPARDTGPAAPSPSTARAPQRSRSRLPDRSTQRRRGERVISTLIVEDDYHVATIHAAYVRKVRGFSVAGHASTAASARSRDQAAGAHARPARPLPPRRPRPRPRARDPRAARLTGRTSW